jgi:electron transfer flavoprotein alpha subunit
MRIAALIKQVPRLEAMELGPDSRLRREGLELEMNAYCRRAVSQGVSLAKDAHGTCTVVTMGVEAARDVLLEALAWGADDAILISDPAFAGSDTFATARILAAALRREDTFDLLLVGRNSVDADTGQVGPQLAEILGLPFVGPVKRLALSPDQRCAYVDCEDEDGYLKAEVDLPAVISCAERLIGPCKVPASGWAAGDSARIRRVEASDLGPGPWGQEGSLTRVGEIRLHHVDREAVRLDGSLSDQVQSAIEVLNRRGAFHSAATTENQSNTGRPQPRFSPNAPIGHLIAVLGEPRGGHITQELLSCATSIGRLTVLDPCARLSAREVASVGGECLVQINGSEVEQDIATAAAEWCIDANPWALLAPATLWGREIASRVAARLGEGLTGDATALEIDAKEPLVAWKPAFGGRLVAAITATSALQIATVRPGALPRGHFEASSREVKVWRIRANDTGRVRVRERIRDDHADALAHAEVVVAAGIGVGPEGYEVLRTLTNLLQAELGATRKVTDNGWLPRSRQIGITGRSIAPRLYIAIGASGKFDHTIGVERAGALLAVNIDPDALIFGQADVGIVGDWHEVVPRLVERLQRLPAFIAT